MMRKADCVAIGLIAGLIFNDELCIFIHSKVPRFVRAIAPKGSLEVTEEAWNCYPHCKTVISNPGYMKEKFHITIETIHREDDTGKIDNIHNLPPELLAQREVIIIDIVNDHVESRVCVCCVCVRACVCVSSMSLTMWWRLVKV